jgi:hypothetical protein
MKRLQKTLARMTALLFLAGCVATVPPVEKTAVVTKPAPPSEQHAIPSRVTEDRDLFSRGLSLLGQPDRPESAKAREAFISLLRRYPQSEWRAAAETLVRLIDEIDSSREAGRRDYLLMEKLRTERSLVFQENASLRKALGDLTVKLRAETTALAQENEKLKRDLQQLRTLEIELEKRDRMLR